MSRPKPPPPTQKALDALAKHRDSRSDEKRRDIEKAITYLRKTNAEINFSTVSRRAKVSRKTIYKHDDLVALIKQYRDRPTTAGGPASTPRCAAGSPPKTKRSPHSKPPWQNNNQPSSYSTANSTPSTNRSPERAHRP